MNSNASLGKLLQAMVLGSVGLLAGCGSVNAEAPIHTAPSASQAPQGGTCVAIQRGCVGAIRDTRIAQAWPDRAYGDQEVAFAGAVGGSARQMLLAVDLSSLPSDAKITRATVELHQRTSGAAALTMHRVLAPWSEKDATWSSFAGAFDPSALTTVSWFGGEDVIVFDATSLVRAWASGDAPNYGIVLDQLKGTTSFATSEAPVLSDRPKLEVCFTQGS